MLGSPERATAVMKSLPACAEAAEVDAVVELGAAGGEVLVAAGADDEGVAGRDRLRHGLPELDCSRIAGDVALHFLEATGVGAGGEGDEAGVNQSLAKLARPVAVKRRALVADATTPVLRKAGSSRSTVQRASPRSALQAYWKSRPLGCCK